MPSCKPGYKRNIRIVSRDAAGGESSCGTSWASTFTTTCCRFPIFRVSCRHTFSRRTRFWQWKIVDEQLLAAIVEARDGLHELGPLTPAVLKAVARHLDGRRVRHSIETGSGASTLLFSHLSEKHKVFAMDTVRSSISAV